MSTKVTKELIVVKFNVPYFRRGFVERMVEKSEKELYSLIPKINEYLAFGCCTPSYKQTFAFPYLLCAW